MRVLVAGSTTWANSAAIRRELALLPAHSLIIHGDTPGADELGGRIAREELGLAVMMMRKNDDDYRRYGRAAWKGLNERMLQQGVDLVLAFHTGLHDPAQARGTRHLVELARAQGVPVRIVTE